MGRPKGSKNKQKSGRVQVKAVKVGRRGRPAGSVNARRAETVTTSGYSREEQSAVETVAQLTLADRILRIEQGLMQLNSYVQNVVNNVNAYINSNPPAPAQSHAGSDQAVLEKAKSNGSHAAAVAAAPEAAIKTVKRGRPAKAAVKAAPVEVTTEDDVLLESDLEEDDFEESYFEEEDVADDFEEDESVI